MKVNFAKRIYTFLAIFVFIVASIFAYDLVVQAQDSRENKNVDELKEEYQQVVEQATEIEKEKNDLQQQVDFFDSKIETLQSEISDTNQKLQQVKDELAGTKQKIRTLQKEIDLQKKFIEQYISTLHAQSDVSLLRVFLSNENLSEMVGSIENVSKIQNSLRETIRDVQKKQERIRNAKKEVFAKERTLEKTKRELQQKKNLREDSKERKQTLLERTTKKLSSYKEKESDLAAKISAITGIEGESVSIKESYEVAQRVSSKLEGNISPEYLVAVMMVESGTRNSVGTNFGTSYYKDALSRCVQRENNGTGFTVDDAKRQEKAFERIIDRLDYSASERYVSSCPVPSYSGMGGAMGYGQFLPATWISWTPHVQALKSSDEFPNPWNLEDASLAIAVKLTNAEPQGSITQKNIIESADNLMQDKALRRQRALSYLGSSKHSWYANHVKSSMQQVKKLMQTEEQTNQSSGSNGSTSEER